MDNLKDRRQELIEYARQIERVRPVDMLAALCPRNEVFRTSGELAAFVDQWFPAEFILAQ